MSAYHMYAVLSSDTSDISTPVLLVIAILQTTIVLLVISVHEVLD